MSLKLNIKINIVQNVAFLLAESQLMLELNAI